MRLLPRITVLEETRLVGMRRKMSFARDETAALWRAFMPRRGEIVNPASSDWYSVQVYGSDFDFGPQSVFEKWALQPVHDFAQVPGGMEPFLLKGGRYAVFAYKGRGGDPAVFKYIFTEWLPASGFSLDDRPHFEVLGKAYKNQDPASEEEIWIPIRQGKGIPGEH